MMNRLRCIPRTLWTTVFFVLLMVSASSDYEPIYAQDSNQALDNWEKLTGTAEHLATVAAIILGALIAYYQFLRGRVFRPRLEPTVSGRIERLDGIDYLIVTLQLKNVGTSRVVIRRESSGLNMFFDQANRLPRNEAKRLNFENVAWEEPVTLPVFENHKWIESGETIQEAKIIAISARAKVVVKLQLRIDTRRTTTVAVAIVRVRSNDD